MNKHRTSFPIRGIAVFVILAVTLGMAGSGERVSAQNPPQQISGYLGNQAIEIDDLDNNPFTTPNANMVSGSPDTCPGSPDPDCPLLVGFTYIDWNDLAVQTSPYGPPAGKYALIDGTGNSDDSFGGTGGSSCLQPAKSPPPKQDIARAYLANNNQYLYFGLVDGTANGSSRHVILFHQNPVTFANATCAGDGHEMSLDLMPGDRMIVAFFQPSATEPAAVVYSVIDDPLNMLMNDAVNFANTALWLKTDTAVNFAVNTTDIPSDLLGGGVSLKANIFGEGAVSLASLGITGCGGVYNVSVVTRTTATGSGEAKDYIGGVYDFGSIEVTADLTPSCDAEFDYSAQAKDQAGVSLPDDDVTYAWTCNNGDSLTFTGKSGTQAADPDTYTCSLSATQISSGCNATKTDLSVNVYAPVGANADLTPSCTLAVPYSGSGSAGSGTYSYAWAFSGACSGSSTTASGTVTLASPGGNCKGDLTVTDAGRTDTLVCTATANDTAAGFVPLAVVPSLTPTCNMGLAGDDATYSSTKSGGSSSGVSYAWTFGTITSGCAVAPASATTASGGLDVTPPVNRGACNVNASVTVTDLRTDKVCTASGGPANTTVYAPIEVSIAPDNTSLACIIPGAPGFSNPNIGPITFTATASGGDGSYSYAWTRTGPNEAEACATTSASCAVDVPDNNYCSLTQIYVGVDDGTSLCALQNSEIENVTKQTQIWATNIP